MSHAGSLTLGNLCNDIILIICDFLQLSNNADETPLKNLSCVDHRLRDVVSTVLFKHLRVDRPIRQLCSMNHLPGSPRSLRLDLSGSMWWWCSGSYVSGSDTRDLFQCIQSLKGLKVLQFSLMSRCLDILDAAFKDALIDDYKLFTLMRIEELRVTHTAAFLASHCPNLERLTIDDSSDDWERGGTLQRDLAPRSSICRSDIKWTGYSQSLTYFDAITTWSMADISFIISLFPRLQHLCMRSHSMRYLSKVENFVPLLCNNLVYLKTLRLIRLSFQSSGWQLRQRLQTLSCNNPALRNTMWLEYEREQVSYENSIAYLAFAHSSTIEMIWLGDKRVARRLLDDDSNDTQCLRWIWHRQLEDISDRMTDAMRKCTIESNAVIVLEEVETRTI